MGESTGTIQQAGIPAGQRSGERRVVSNGRIDGDGIRDGDSREANEAADVGADRVDGE